MAVIPIKTVSTPIFNTTTLSFQPTGQGQYGGYSSAQAQQIALKEAIAQSQKQNPEKFQNYENTAKYINKKDIQVQEPLVQKTIQASPVITKRIIQPVKKIENIQPPTIKQVQGSTQINKQIKPVEYNPLGEFAKGATNIVKDYGGTFDPNHKSKSMINQGIDGIISGNKNNELSNVGRRIIDNPIQFAGELAMEAPLYILPIGPAVKAIRGVTVATKTILKGQQMLAHPEVLTKFTPKQIESVERLVDTASTNPTSYKKLEKMVSGLDKSIQKDIDKQLKVNKPSPIKSVDKSKTPQEIKQQIKEVELRPSHQIKKPGQHSNKLGKIDTFVGKDGERYTYSPGGFSQTKAQVAEMDKLKQIATDKSLPLSTRTNAIRTIEKYTKRVYPPKTDFTDASTLRGVGLGVGVGAVGIGLGTTDTYADNGLGSSDPFAVFGKTASDVYNFFAPQKRLVASSVRMSSISKPPPQKMEMSSYVPKPIKKPPINILGGGVWYPPNITPTIVNVNGKERMFKTYENAKKFADNYGVKEPNPLSVRMSSISKPPPQKVKYVSKPSSPPLSQSRSKTKQTQTVYKPLQQSRSKKEFNIVDNITNFFGGGLLPNAYADGKPTPQRTGQTIWDTVNPFIDPYKNSKIPAVVATPQNQSNITVQTPTKITVTLGGKTRTFKNQKAADEFVQRYKNPTPRQPAPIKTKQRDLMAEFNNEISTNSIDGVYIGKPVTQAMLDKIGNSKSVQNKSKTELALEQQRLDNIVNTKQNVTYSNYNPMSREALEKGINNGINKSYNSQQFLNYYDKNRNNSGLFANPYFGKPMGYKLPEYGKPKPK